MVLILGQPGSAAAKGSGLAMVRAIMHEKAAADLWAAASASGGV